MTSLARRRLARGLEVSEVPVTVFVIVVGGEFEAVDYTPEGWLVVVGLDLARIPDELVLEVLVEGVAFTSMDQDLLAA